jgi:cold shock CspA family protein
MDGTVRTINHEKAFGFIKSDEGDFFFHRSAVEPATVFPELQVGTRVTFDPNPRAPKGPRAEKVQLL